MNPQDVPPASGIYRITCTITGRFYIGSATSLRERCRHHRNELRRKTHCNAKLQNAWNKHGEETFVFEVLEFVLIPEMLTAREQFWFTKLNPFGERGFNLDHVAGSALGREHSQETRAKISSSHIGMRPFLGKAHTQETKEKISAANLGKTRSEEVRARMKITNRG